MLPMGGHTILMLIVFCPCPPSKGCNLQAGQYLPGSPSVLCHQEPPKRLGGEMCGGTKHSRGGEECVQQGVGG